MVKGIDPPLCGHCKARHWGTTHVYGAVSAIVEPSRPIVAPVAERLMLTAVATGAHECPICGDLHSWGEGENVAPSSLSITVSPASVTETPKTVTKRPVGRPAKAVKVTSAERQKAYRERRKAEA